MTAEPAPVVDSPEVEQVKSIVRAWPVIRATVSIAVISATVFYGFGMLQSSIESQLAQGKENDSRQDQSIDAMKNDLSGKISNHDSKPSHDVSGKELTEVQVQVKNLSVQQRAGFNQINNRLNSIDSRFDIMRRGIQEDMLELASPRPGHRRRPSTLSGPGSGAP